MMAIVEAVIVMLSDHWFWGGLTLAVLVWYSTVTVYVTFKGVGDIRSMLRTLRSRKESLDNGQRTIDNGQ